MVEYCCCPAANPSPDMEMNETVKRYRQVLKTFVYGELGSVIAHAYLFGLFTGFFHLIHMWIDWAAYASSNHCAALIVAFAAGLDLIMLFMNANDGGPLHDAIFENTLSQLVFYTMFVFSAVKLLACFKI